MSLQPMFVGGVPGGMESAGILLGIFLVQAAAFYYLGKSRAQSKTIEKLEMHVESPEDR